MSNHIRHALMFDHITGAIGIVGKGGLGDGRPPEPPAPKPKRGFFARLFSRNPNQSIANLSAAETPLSIEQPYQSKIPTQPQGEGDRS